MKRGTDEPQQQPGTALGSSVSRLRTCVKGLDERLEGGIPAGYVVLISGTAGTMKTSLAFSILYSLAREKKAKGLYVSLEQGRDSILRHMGKLGFGCAKVEPSYLTIIDLAFMRKVLKEDPQQTELDIPWLESLRLIILNQKNTIGCDIVVVDSLSALYSLIEMKRPRAELFHFFNMLKSLGMTCLLISEMAGRSAAHGVFGIEEFVSDAIIHLDMERERKSVNLFLGVVKMRETKHDRSYYPLLFTQGQGFEIVSDR